MLSFSINCKSMFCPSIHLKSLQKCLATVDGRCAENWFISFLSLKILHRYFLSMRILHRYFWNLIKVYNYNPPIFLVPENTPQIFLALVKVLHQYFLSQKILQKYFLLQRILHKYFWPWLKYSTKGRITSPAHIPLNISYTREHLIFLTPTNSLQNISCRSSHQVGRLVPAANTQIHSKQIWKGEKDYWDNWKHKNIQMWKSTNTSQEIWLIIWLG